MPAARPKRAAARRQRVVESSSDEEPEVVDETEEQEESDDEEEQVEEEEEYTPKKAVTPRRSSNRAPSATPSASVATTSRARRTRSGEVQTPPSTRGRDRGRGRGRGARATQGGPRISESPSEATQDTPAPNSPAVQTPQPEPRTLTPRARAATPKVPPTPAPQPQTPKHVTPSSAQQPVPSQLSPAVQPSPARSLRLGAPGASAAAPPSGSRPQSSSSSQAPPFSQIDPIVIKSRANALLSQPLPSEDAGPKQRLVITHLVLNNFKSYAGERMVGPFHPSFTSVVGPNGSGKSNVIDSLLFVFGFRASKMRQGKLSALIHNSAAFSNVDSCSVEVHFQEVLDLPDGTHEVVPNSKLVVSRRAWKNNTNTYYINGRRSNYEEVTTLLKGRGIDLDHKRFLILQGEVESIAQMKPKAQAKDDDGLLEYLEDIIGTSKYKQPILDSAAEQEELNEVCMEKSTRVQHVEKEKNALQDKTNVALEYIRAENELALEKNALFQLNMRESEENIHITSELIAKVQAELDAELESFRGAEQEIKKLEKKCKIGAKEVEDIEEQTQAILRETSRAEKEKVKFQEKEKFLVQKQKKLQKSIQTSKLQASEATAMIGRHRSDIERLGEEASQLTENLEVEEAELAKITDELKEKTQGFSDQIAAKQKTLEPWNERINEKRGQIAVAQSELDMIHEKSNSSKVALEEAQAKIERIEESRKAKQAELKECEKEKAALEKEAQKVQAELQKMVQKEPEIKNTLASARSKAEEARSSAASVQSQGKVLTALMRLQESGRIEGFHGRLGNLGTIDIKYDVAVSTACGALNNLVLDKVETSEQCFDYLRKNGLGRATVICLDKMRKFDMSPIKTPENVPRLFDLIKPKSDKFKPAFYSVLGDTLVADDLNQARRIAYGKTRYRVVTLDGELIEKAGTMSGGGRERIRGLMSSKLPMMVSPEALQKMDREAETQERSYAEFLDQQRGLQSRVREISDRIPELDVTVSKIELEIDASVRHKADAERRIKELSQGKGASDTDKNRITALEKKIEGLQAEIEQLQAETSEVEEEIKVLQDKIMKVGGMRLRTQKAKVDGIREQLETINEQISSTELAANKAEKAKKKAEKTSTSAEEELEGMDTELQGIQEDLKTLAANARENQEKADEANAFLETKKEELAVLKEEHESKVADLNKTRAAEIEMKNKLEEHQKALNENQRRCSHWKEQIATLKLHNIQELSGEDDSGDYTKLPLYTDDEMADMDKHKLQSNIAVLEEKIKDVNIDLSVLADYRKRVEEYAARNNDLQGAINERDAVKARLDDLRKRRLEEFMEGFNTISLRLKEMYQMITMGGNAELELVDSLDPFSEGILFSVMPPKKSWKNISNLSGGEKTLSSLALVFALHHYKPTPLYVMDEIDAALDFRNVSIVASYIKERTKNAQFIVISLRNNMFELAARLVGVYKVNHMTKSVTIENKPYIEGST
ncbi:putative nuclear condensin complex subunit Smc4 [Sphaerosporella brunnea]|uniref:Structural maintenance of chromosomes protein n=1 Tax=Sphaerosporella brunnea TaxID=1250544 RepID=A0A5J5F9S3_9PEZI|nr:putative nuclear condensin complex subunit Smc4 [Sphaerosporella brunnea]